MIACKATQALAQWQHGSCWRGSPTAAWRANAKRASKTSPSTSVRPSRWRWIMPSHPQSQKTKVCSLKGVLWTKKLSCDLQLEAVIPGSVQLRRYYRSELRKFGSGKANIGTFYTSALESIQRILNPIVGMSGTEDLRHWD